MMARITLSENEFERLRDVDDVRDHGSRPSRGPLAVKVPQITAVFWVLKLLTTAMGENASDYLMHTSQSVGVAVGVGGFVGTVGLQFWCRRYRPVVYWAAVSMVAVAGTMVADVLHGVGVPLPLETVVCAVALGATFWVWHRCEGTLSVHSISSTRREVFYWLTVSFTFALGTALGDLTADTVGLGFVGSIVLFAAAMAVPIVGCWRLGFNGVAAFWCAYVLTRPLGASIADWLGKPAGHGGMGFGDGPVAVVLLSTIIVIVAAISLGPVLRPPAGAATGATTGTSSP